MTEAGNGGIFISYRRRESSDPAGRLYDRLAERFGENQVFMDVDKIAPGVDFGEEISRAVAACRVLLAVIGPTWLTMADERGRRRLDDPDDLVRLEVEAALSRDVWVTPILTAGAVMPARHDLPESMADLARRNALTIRHESFGSDTGRLIAAIERVLVAHPSAPSISDEPGKVGSPVESRAVGNDRARAARLIADAERISITAVGTWRVGSRVSRLSRKPTGVDAARVGVASAVSGGGQHLAVGAYCEPSVPKMDVHDSMFGIFPPDVWQGCPCGVG
jgi:hypothetical protein